MLLYRSSTVSKKKVTDCRSTGTGDVSAAAKVDVDNIPSVCISGSDNGGGDNSATAHGHQLPLVVCESELPGLPSVVMH